MTIRKITIGELNAFIHSDEFKASPVIPISSHRAISYIKNPRAAEGDVVLILAYKEDKLCGYLGVLPDHFFPDNHAEKIGWMSCIWVDSCQRGAGIAEQLINEAFDAWDGRILATEFTAAAKRLYDKTQKFNDLTTLYGIRAYLRFNLHQLLPPKQKSFKKAAPILKMVDGAVNIFNDVRLKLSKPEEYYEVVKVSDQEFIDFISEHNQTELFKRNIEDLTWIKNYPWLKVGNRKDAEAQKYHFSAITSQFYNQFIQFNDNGNRVGVALTEVRDRHLKLPYIYFDKKDTEAVAKGVLQLMIDQKLNMLTTYNPFLAEYILCNRAPYYKARPFMREYLISKKVEDLPSDVIIQDGDGDCAFT